MLPSAFYSHLSSKLGERVEAAVWPTSRAHPAKLQGRCKVAFPREYSSLHDQAHLAAESLVAKSQECVAQYRPHSSVGQQRSAGSSSIQPRRLKLWQSTPTPARHTAQPSSQQTHQACSAAAGAAVSSTTSPRWPWSLWQQHNRSSSGTASSSSSGGGPMLLLERSAAAVTEQHARRALLQATPYVRQVGPAAVATTAAVVAAVDTQHTTAVFSSTYVGTATESFSGGSGSSWEEQAAALRMIDDSLWETDSDSSSTSDTPDSRTQLFLYDLMPPAAAAAVAGDDASSSSSNSGSNAKLALLLGDTYPNVLSELDSSGQAAGIPSARHRKSARQQQQQQHADAADLVLQANTSIPPVPQPSTAMLQRAVKGVGPLGRPRPASSNRQSSSALAVSNSSASSSGSSGDEADWLTAVLSAPTSRLSSHSNAVLTNSLRRLASLRNTGGSAGPAAAAAGVDSPEGLLESIRSRFGTFQLQHFEEVALQLAQLGYKPDTHWLAAFERSSQAMMHGGSPRLLSRLLLSRAKLPGPVSSDWCAECCQHMAAAPSKLSVSSWANALYALVRLKHAPSRHFQTTFFMATAERLDDISPELLTHLVWSLARLKFTPSFMWLRSLTTATASIEKPFTHAQLASLVHSLALWAEPGGIAAHDVQRFVDLLLVEIHEHLGVLQPAELTTVVWSLGSLVAGGKLLPDPQLQDELLEAIQGQLPRLNPVQCSNLCWGLAKLNHRLPDGFAEALLLEVQAQLAGFTNTNLSSVLWALARLELVPLSPFRQQLWEELQHRVKSFSLSEVSTVLWALAQLDLQPPEDILADLCDCAAPHVSTCEVADLTNIVWALGRLHARPGKEWVETAESASLQALPTAGLTQVVNIAWGLSRLHLAATKASSGPCHTAALSKGDTCHGHTSMSDNHRDMSMSETRHCLSTAWQAACLRELRLRCMCAGHDVDCSQLVQMLADLGVVGLAEVAAAAADKLFAEQEDEAVCSLQFQPGCR